MDARDAEKIDRLTAENARLRAAEWKARGERDSMKRRLELLTADESWWIGGAWGDYGEVVIPVRAVHMVLGWKDAELPELEPGLAATYRDLHATVEHLSAENAQRDDPALLEALVSGYSILSLLHHRGLVDSPMNRQDVAAALDKLQPFAKAAEQRMMSGRT